MERIVYSKEIEALLTKHKVFSRPSTTEHRWSVGKDFLMVPKDICIEPYTGFLVGNVLFSIGSFSYTRSILPVHTKVGRYSSIAPGVSVMGINHPIDRFTTSSLTYSFNSITYNTYLKDNGLEFPPVPSPKVSVKPLIIGNDVWIGSNVTFSSKGIKVNDGAVIAANTVVTKDVPPYSVVAGNPGKIVKYRFTPTIIEELQNLNWWEYEYGKFKDISSNEPIESFIKKMKKQIVYEEIKKYNPKNCIFYSTLLDKCY